MPMLAEKKLTPFQGLLHAIWTDERISCGCVSMRNTDQIRENADAARRFEPLKAAEIHQLRDAALAHGPTLCADCDGRCSAAAGTTAELGNLTRFLTYHEHHGDRAEARRQYAALSARGPRLVRRRPRGRPRRLPQPARLRQAAARGRSPAGVTWFYTQCIRPLPQARVHGGCSCIVHPPCPPFARGERMLVQANVPPLAKGGLGGWTKALPNGLQSPRAMVVVSRRLSEEPSPGLGGRLSRYNPFASMYASTPRGTMKRMLLPSASRRRRSLEAMPMGGIVTSCSGFASGPKSGKAAGSTSSMPGRLTTTIVASRAIPRGSRQSAGRPGYRPQPGRRARRRAAPLHRLSVSML